METPAFDPLWDAHRHVVRAVLRRFVPLRSEDALDIEQRARIRAWRAFHRFDPSQSFAAWVRTIAYREWADWHRERAYLVAMVPNEPDEAGRTPLEKAVDPGPSPFDLATWNHLSPEMVVALDALTRRQLLALRLFANGSTKREIATAFRCTEGIAAALVFRARVKAAAYLA